MIVLFKSFGRKLKLFITFHKQLVSVCTFNAYHFGQKGISVGPGVQPVIPINAEQYIPDDALDLIRVLNENRTSIIPTCDLLETYYHMMRNCDGCWLKIKVSPSNYEGWSRIEVNPQEGRLVREIFRNDFPQLFNE